MRWLGLLCLAVGIALAGQNAPAQATDLTKIERAIGKAPVYQSKAPRYALLVFGPEAKTRVWLVHDGDKMYVDRNANGDLTEPGECVQGTKAEGGGISFKLGEVRDGKLIHTELEIATASLQAAGAELAAKLPALKKFLGTDPKGQIYNVSVAVAMPGHKGSGPDGRISQMTYLFDSRGFLQFAARPQDAPIIHFCGPWSLTLFAGFQSLRLGEESELVLALGTPGLGAGASAYVCYEELVPADVFPVVDMTFPPKNPGSEPVKARYTLKQRC